MQESDDSMKLNLEDGVIVLKNEFADLEWIWKMDY